MRFLLCLILPLSVLAQRPDTVRLYPVNFLQGMMLGDTNYQDAYMIAELGKIQLERYSKELKQHALQKELENQKLQTASLEQKLLSQRIQAEANQKQQRQQQRISRLEIHSLNQKAMLQERTRDFLVAGVVFLLLVGILLLRLNTKLKTKNAALIQKNREISEALLKGQTIERKRVASELHDSLGGLLSAVKLTMQTIHAEDLSPQEQPIYRNLIGMVNEAGQQVRSLSHNLLPDELEEKGLVNSLERLVTKLNYTQKTHFDLKISGLDERLDKNVEFNLYTICLELCNNILKHAEATEVQIELIKKNEALQLFVSDNGQGFSVEDTTNGMGMKNLKARASALNAKLHIQSKPYEGTLVSMKMPLVTFAIKNYFFALLFLMSYSAASLGQSSTLDILRKKIKTIEHLPKTYANDTLRVGLLNDLATVTFRTDTVENAIPIAQKALQLAQKIKWNHGVLVSYKTLVSAENISNRHYDAIKHGLAGLALAEKLNHRYFRVFFSRSLGNNYDMLDNYEKAIPYYEACLKLSENVEATLPTRANALVELGDAYRVHLKKPLQARHLIEQAIEIYKKVAPASIGYAYDYLGLALTDLNDYPQAEEAFRQSRIALDKYKKNYLISELLVHTSQLYLKEKKYVLAQKYAQEAYDFSRKMGTVYGESEAVKVLYLANKALQNTRKALIYYESYASLRDSFTQANMNSKFAQIQAEYEAERQKDQINQLKLAQKNQEIHEKNLIQYFLVGLLLVLVAFVYWVVINNKKLRKKNQEINQALLKGQTIERKRVASELHDSLGGLLSALKINMYGIHVNDLHPEEQEIYRNLIGMVNEAVQQVRSLSHNLLPDELEEKGLVNSLERLVTKLNYTQKTHFDLRISGLDERLDKNVEFNLYAICLELCNNILKHAEATEVQIELIKKNEVLQLFVIDNGQGFSVEDTTNGMGMKNLKARASALNAKLHIQSKPYEGTVVSLALPLTSNQLAQTSAQI